MLRKVSSFYDKEKFSPIFEKAAAKIARGKSATGMSFYDNVYNAYLENFHIMIKSLPEEFYRSFYDLVNNENATVEECFDISIESDFYGLTILNLINESEKAPDIDINLQSFMSAMLKSDGIGVRNKVENIIWFRENAMIPRLEQSSGNAVLVERLRAEEHTLRDEIYFSDQDELIKNSEEEYNLFYTAYQTVAPEAAARLNDAVEIAFRENRTLLLNEKRIFKASMTLNEKKALFDMGAIDQNEYDNAKVELSNARAEADRYLEQVEQSLMERYEQGDISAEYYNGRICQMNAGDYSYVVMMTAEQQNASGQKSYDGTRSRKFQNLPENERVRIAENVIRFENRRLRAEALADANKAVKEFDRLVKENEAEKNAGAAERKASYKRYLKALKANNRYKYNDLMKETKKHASQNKKITKYAKQELKIKRDIIKYYILAERNALTEKELKKLNSLRDKHEEVLLKLDEAKMAAIVDSDKECHYLRNEQVLKEDFTYGITYSVNEAAEYGQRSNTLSELTLDIAQLRNQEKIPIKINLNKDKSNLAITPKRQEPTVNERNNQRENEPERE